MELIKDAEEKLLHQFEKSSKLKGLISSLILPFQEAMSHIDNLHYGRYIDAASGPTLDVIGDIVGQPRLGMSDDDFKPWIKVRIHLNNGSGTPESVLAILIILFGAKANIQMEEYPPNDVVFTFFKFPKFPAKTLFTIIRNAVPVTTQCRFIDASTPSPSRMEIASIRGTNTKKQSYRTFQFDFTSFSESHFADFFEEDFHV